MTRGEIGCSPCTDERRKSGQGAVKKVVDFEEEDDLRSQVAGSDSYF